MDAGCILQGLCPDHARDDRSRNRNHRRSIRRNYDLFAWACAGRGSRGLSGHAQVRDASDRIISRSRTYTMRSLMWSAHDENSIDKSLSRNFSARGFPDHTNGVNLTAPSSIKKPYGAWTALLRRSSRGLICPRSHSNSPSHLASLSSSLNCHIAALLSISRFDLSLATAPQAAIATLGLSGATTSAKSFPSVSWRLFHSMAIRPISAACFARRPTVASMSSLVGNRGL